MFLGPSLMFRLRLITSNRQMMCRNFLMTVFQSKTFNICWATRCPSKSFQEFFLPRATSTKSTSNSVKWAKKLMKCARISTSESTSAHSKKTSHFWIRCSIRRLISTLWMMLWAKRLISNRLLMLSTERPTDRTSTNSSNKRPTFRNSITSLHNLIIRLIYNSLMSSTR